MIDSGRRQIERRVCTVQQYLLWHCAWKSALKTMLAGYARPVEDLLGVLWLSYQLRVPPLIISIAFEGKTHSSSKAIAQAFNRQFTACSAQHNRALSRPTHEGPSPPPSFGLLLLAVRREKRRSGHKEGGLSHCTGAWRDYRATPLPSRWARPDIPDGALPPLSSRSWHPGNLEELGHNPDTEGSSQETRAAPTAPSHCSSRQWRYWRGSASRPSWRQWVLAPPSTDSNWFTPPARHCSLFQLGWSFVLTSVSPLAEP